MEAPSQEDLLAAWTKLQLVRAARQAKAQTEEGKEKNRQRARLHYERHREAVLAKRKEYYENNRDMLSERQKGYYQKRKTGIKSDSVE